MADFTRMSAVDADTELREMRQLLLTKQSQLQNGGDEARKTTTRIQAINRALQSLAAEKPAQAEIFDNTTAAPLRPAKRKEPKQPT